MTSISNTIKYARISNQLDIEYIARELGLAPAYASDIEEDDDEVLTNLALGKYKKMCKLLNLDPLSTLGLQSKISSDSPNFDNFIRKAFTDTGLTVEAVADKIGFEDSIVEAIYNNPKNINSLPINVCTELFDLLHISPALLFSPLLSID